MAYKNIELRRANQKARVKRNRAELVALLGGECVVCGDTENLHFHHKDPSQKEFTIGAAVAFPREERIKEALKCELRCRTHHLEIHAPVHGTESMFRSGCRCDRCVEGKREYNKKWMAEWRSNGKDKSRKNFKE
jgi:hypothetical protein